MTPLLKPIAASFHTTNKVLFECLPDLQEQDARQRIRSGSGPSIAWQIGHMLDYRCKIMKLLGAKKESPYTAKYSVAAASDGSDYPSIAEFTAQWKQIDAELDAALESASEESLGRITEKGPHGEKTAFEQIAFFTWHEAYHIGAFGTIRKELGYPGPAEMVRAKMARQPEPLLA